jgi:hypothetical protein
MQTLKEKLKEDLKVAFKTSDNSKKELIRMVLSEIALEEGRGAAGFLLNNEGVMAVIKKMKKNSETIVDGCKESGREVDNKILKEIEILSSYLPKQLTEDQIKMLVADIMEELGTNSIKDMGKIMSKFNSQFAGQADGKIVSQIVKERLK